MYLLECVWRVCDCGCCDDIGVDSLMMSIHMCMYCTFKEGVRSPASCGVKIVCLSPTLRHTAYSGVASAAWKQDVLVCEEYVCTPKFLQ